MAKSNGKALKHEGPLPSFRYAMENQTAQRQSGGSAKDERR